MSTIVFTSQTTPATPTTGKVRLYIDSGDDALKSVDDLGNITAYAPTSNEQIQDIVGSFIQAGSTKVVVTYNDAGNILSIDIDPSQISHTNLSSIGTNTHAQIDTHLANTSNPHSTTKSQIGLSNVDNTSDINKPISTATQTALNGKEATITAGTISQYWRGDKTFQTLDKTAVGLSNVVNLDTSNPANITQDSTHRFVSDAEKTTWNAKQNALGYTPENLANKGAVNGYASLDGTGKVPSAQLPSFVDDVLEYANLASFPVTGTTGVIYVDIATNKTYRWSGSSYIEISPSAVTSVFTRTGAVVAQSGDYSATQITNFDAQAIIAAKTNLTATPPPLYNFTDSATQGVSTEFARADHVHHVNNSGVLPGIYGNSAQSPQITINSKGVITSAANANISINAASVQGLTEEIQDVVGAFAIDSTTIDFTYSDVGNTLTAAVIPGGVNHNSLLNGGGNIHIDHSVVNITAGTGLSGGGDITATRTLNIANTGVTAGTYGSASQNQVITVNAQGQITAASSNNIIDAPLTGFVAAAGDVVATDSIIQAIEKLTGNDNQWIELMNTTQLTTTSSVTLSNVTELQFPVTSGVNYYFEVTALFQTVSTTTGLTLSIGSPDGATASIAAQVNIPIAADGTTALYTGSLTSLADVVTGTGVQTTNTDFVATIKGTIACTTSGNLCPQFRSEVGGSTVRLQPRSVILIREF